MVTEKTIIVVVLICSIFIITIFALCLILQATEKKDLPPYVFNAARRSDLPKKILVNKNADTAHLYDNIQRQLIFAVSNYNTRMKAKIFVYEPALDSNLDTITVGVERANHGCLSSFDGRLGIMAHANTPGTRICMDKDEEWTSDSILRTLMHEMGHTLGLRHVPNQHSIMTPYYSNVPRNLTDYDVQLINTMLDRSSEKFYSRIQSKNT